MPSATCQCAGKEQALCKRYLPSLERDLILQVLSVMVTPNILVVDVRFVFCGMSVSRVSLIE